MCFLTYVAPQKRCRKCGISQCWESFNTDKNISDGMSSLCKACSALKQRVLYEKHQAKNAAKARERRLNEGDKLRAQARVRYVKRREHFLAEKRAEYAANLEKFRERNRKRHIKHRAKLIAKSRANYAQHPEKWVEWRANNPDAVRLASSRRRARLRNLPDTFTVADNAFMMEYWHQACVVCGNEEGFWHTLSADHWIPITSPDCPGTVAENLIPLCHGQNGCNNSKHDRDPEEWLLSWHSPAKAKRILKAVEDYFAVIRARKGQAAAD